MSSFFMNVKKTFLNQSIEKDFKKEDNRYKDLSICLESEKCENNCFFSSNDYCISMEFFENFMLNYYIDQWESNDYTLLKFGIEKKI